jgi:capsular polysaccharide biosynthesis protein
MTEQLSRMWAWDTAVGCDPGVRALLHAIMRRPALEPFETELYTAAGVPSEGLVLAQEPVLVERLYAATPMFSNHEYVHPDIQQVWDSVSDRLVAQAPDRDYPTRIFCSRGTSKRACRNSGQVEELFAAHGFEIILPERYPLAQQVALFRSAQVVAGFAGSAMLTLALSREPKRVLLVSSRSYIAQNEYMIAAVMGHEVDVAYCRPDRLMRPDRFRRRRYHSDFTFDPDREGTFLERSFASIGPSGRRRTHLGPGQTAPGSTSADDGG